LADAKRACLSRPGGGQAIIHADAFGAARLTQGVHMTHDSKLESYRQHMTARGVGWATAFPPLWHVLWSCGLRIPPPPFLSFPAMALLAGGFFGPLFALCAWLLRMRGLDYMPVQEALWLALGTGVAFGLAMATYYRYLARKQGLGSWAAFPASAPRA
jgi:hypothetical protein